MKRKIIKLGQATYVMSIPSKWIRENDLDKGDYIDVSEEEGDLIVQATSKKRSKKITVDIKGLDTKLATSYLENAYVLGFDPIEIIHPQELSLYSPGAGSKKKSISSQEFILNTIHKKFIGSDIIEQTEKRTVIKDLGGGHDEESMDNVFRRCLFLLKDVITSTKEILETREIGKIPNVLLKTEHMTKLLLYYLRVLNSSKTSPEIVKIKIIMTDHLRFIKSTYQVMLRDIKFTGNFYSKQSVELFNHIATQAEKMVSLLFKYNQDKAVEFIHGREKVWKMIYEFKPSGEDHLLYSQFGVIMGSVWYITKARITEEILKKKV